MKDAAGHTITLGQMVRYGTVAANKTGQVIAIITQFKNRRQWVQGKWERVPTPTDSLKLKVVSMWGNKIVRVLPTNVLLVNPPPIEMP